jgi:hypothetical protein
MDNTALTLIVFTNLMLVLILGILAFLVYRLIKNKDTPETPTQPLADMKAPEAQYHPAILERIKEMQKIKPKRAQLFCPNHTEEPGEASCAICDNLFCKACIRPFKSLHFCKEHLPLIMRHEWDEVLTIKTSTHDPEEGVRLYDVKKRILEEQNIPTFIETHYKINVDHDYIETYLVLYATKESVESVRSLIGTIN